jgi:hypothetical protein
MCVPFDSLNGREELGPLDGLGAAIRARSPTQDHNSDRTGESRQGHAVESADRSVNPRCASTSAQGSSIEKFPWSSFILRAPDVPCNDFRTLLRFAPGTARAGSLVGFSKACMINFVLNSIRYLVGLTYIHLQCCPGGSSNSRNLSPGSPG